MNTHTAFYPQLKEMVINSGYESVTDGHVKYRDMMNALKQGEVKSIQVNEHAADLPDVVFAFYEHVKMQNLVQKDWYSGLIISQQHAPSTLTKMILKKKIGTENISGADLTLAPRVIDGLFLLNALSNHPKIDKNRIGIQGYSYGGMVAFFTAYEGLINKVGVQYAAHMPVYPGCDVVIKDMVTTSAPILMIIAENDDYAPAADCIDYGPNIGKIKIYKDAYHGFISTKKKKEFLKNTGHFNDCERGYIQDDGKWFYNGKTRNGTESEIFSEIWKECGNQGVHIGGTNKIRELLIEDTIEFFSKHLLEN